MKYITEHYEQALRHMSSSSQHCKQNK